ncbi:hypothetical protein BP422_24410 [Brevibacillus formosus]|uniref:Uncharacterized protein n=1 Tax=Brevibacillus formosus TaxID=54913 RepID=A0A220MMW7_9BACL|nr:hypothetical protein BP422_24410 [Brevibacillus formosus]
MIHLLPRKVYQTGTYVPNKYWKKKSTAFFSGADLSPTLAKAMQGLEAGIFSAVLIKTKHIAGCHFLYIISCYNNSFYNNFQSKIYTKKE